MRPMRPRDRCSDVDLTRETAAAGYRVLSLDVTGSTNDDALAAACDGDPGRLWVCAGEQKAGRGRHGRTWSSPAGNLYASLLLIDPCPMTLAPQLGFVAGLALHDAVSQAASVGTPRLALKWPNDLLLDGAKVSGLLLEGHRIVPTGALAVIIGFGVNIIAAPAGTPYPTATLATVAPSLSREAVFAALADAFARTFSAWQASCRANMSDPFLPIRRLWLERAAGLGATISVRLPLGERRGTFKGLDAHGRLQLKTSSGMELIDAGDLYFPNLKAEPTVGGAGS
jgi:BirA family biotin operon repressor/biotin-[acetyl-CoA-carboxylase] ligase